MTKFLLKKGKEVKKLKNSGLVMLKVRKSVFSHIGKYAVVLVLIICLIYWKIKPVLIYDSLLL